MKKMILLITILLSFSSFARHYVVCGIWDGAKTYGHPEIRLVHDLDNLKKSRPMPFPNRYETNFYVGAAANENGFFELYVSNPHGQTKNSIALEMIRNAPKNTSFGVRSLRNDYEKESTPEVQVICYNTINEIVAPFDK